MNNLRKILFILTFVSSSFSCLSATHKCGSETCYSGRYLQDIRFPFRVADRERKECGYPGFDLKCKQGNITLELSNSVFLSISYIDYEEQKINLEDPDGCLPKKILLLNNYWVDSPTFHAMSYYNLSIFNCSGNYENGYFNGSHLDYDFQKVDCLSGSSYTVYAVYVLLMRVVSVLSSSCNWVANVSVPTGYVYSSSNMPTSYITLHWDEPRCEPCEKINKRCRVKGHGSSHETECTSESIYAPEESHIARISLPLGVGVALLLSILFISCLIHLLTRHRYLLAIERSSTTPPTMVTTYGIDQSTLDTYPRVVIGGSGRLIKPDDNACPICLSEYQIDQVLTILPYCQHRFHTDCIDQWLVVNGTCPVCREPLPC